MIDVLRTGNKEDILNFIRTTDLMAKSFNVTDIYFLLHDKKFYQDVLQILEKRFMYNLPVYSFSLLHNDLETLKKLFIAAPKHLEGFQFSYINSNCFGIDNFMVKEYHPLINSRVHDLSNRSNNIRDNDFKKTYLSLLTYLFEKQTPTNEDNL